VSATARFTERSRVVGRDDENCIYCARHASGNRGGKVRRRSRELVTQRVDSVPAEQRHGGRARSNPTGYRERVGFENDVTRGDTHRRSI
jgi:hypothetical protein